MTFLEDARALQPELVELRRALHRNPEVGLHLPHTQAAVLEALDGLGLEITTGMQTSSIVAVLRGDVRPETDAPVVLLRGDMDALPMEEKTGLDFASQNDAMHACGHDLHTACLVGAARLLSAHRDGLVGDVVFMFQPGEEGWDGAGIMIDEGVLEASGRKADAAYALHVTAGWLEAHQVGCRPGPLQAASRSFTVEVRGNGTHGSMPFLGRDPIPAMAEMIGALQTMVTRRFDVFDPVVVTVGKVWAGTQSNIIPDTAHFEGTVRLFSETNGQRIRGLIEQTLEGVAAAHGVAVDVQFGDGYPVTVNDPEEALFVELTTQELLGVENYVPLTEPGMASEDFSRVLAEVPGAMFHLGATPEGMDVDAVPSNHDPRAVFNKDVIATGAALLATLTHRKLLDLRLKEDMENMDEPLVDALAEQALEAWNNSDPSASEELRHLGAVLAFDGIAQNGGLVGGAIENIRADEDDPLVAQAIAGFQWLGLNDVVALIERADSEYQRFRPHGFEELTPEDEALWEELDEEYFAISTNDRIVQAVQARAQDLPAAD